jgi:hypothetical protein
MRRAEKHETLSERFGTGPELRLSDIVDALIALHDQSASPTHATHGGAPHSQ